MRLLLAAAVLALPATAHAGERTLFTCKLGFKSATVSANGDALIYRYGTAKKAELTITGGPGIGNVFHLTHLMSGRERQLRFKRGPYDYTIFSIEPNVRTGAKGVSGLVVKKDGKQLSYRFCRPYASFREGYDWDVLPQDGVDYSAP